MRDLNFGSKKKFQPVFLLIICLSLSSGFANQDDFFDKVQKKLTFYYQEAHPLKISLIFSQPVYTPGDTAYFKIRLLLANKLQPVAEGSIIHINLVDSIGQSVHAQKIKIIDGEGFNQIPIPATLKPGYYTIVAYNDWMKNSDKSLFAYYQIRIAGDQKFKRILPSYDFDFFPEGGHLIDDINNKIVFTGPSNSTVTVNNKNSKAVLEVKLNEDGIGFGFLMPEKTVSYTASIGEKEKRLLTESDGIGLLTTISEADTSVNCTLQVPKNSMLRNQPLRFLLSAHDDIYYAAQLNFKGKTQAKINIPRQGLPETLLLITIFNGDESVIAQRMIQVPARAYAKDKLINVKKEYSIREKVIIGLDISDGKSVASMHVINTDFFEKIEMRSEFKESVETLMDLPFSGLGIPENLRQHIGSNNWNDLLLTQRWRRFSWEDVLHEKIWKEYPFNQFLGFKGRVQRKDKPFGAPAHINFFFQNTGAFYETQTDGNGNFNISVFDFYGTEEVYCTIDDLDDAGDNIDIEIREDTISEFPKIGPYQFLGTDNFTGFVKNKRVIDAAFGATVGTVTIPKEYDRSAFFESMRFVPDETILLKDYLQFPDMHETIREIIPNLKHKIKDGRNILRINLRDNSSSPPIIRSPKHAPLYIIDGIITDNSDYFMSLSPKDVVSVKLMLDVSRLNSLGGLGKNGIVMVETKIPNNYQNVPRSKNIFSINGLTNSKQLNPLVTGNNNVRIPKIGTTLYFNPEIVTNDKGKATAEFYAPDNTGNFRILIEGFDSAGKPFNDEEDFSVKFKPSLNP